jgi:chaperonin cofactor prefoldin
MLMLMQSKGQEKLPQYQQLEKQIQATNQKIALITKQIDELSAISDTGCTLLHVIIYLSRTSKVKERITHPDP